MLSKCLVALLPLAALMPAAHGHGYLSEPPARNANYECKQCLNGGGTASVNANGQYIHGICGNAPTEPQNWNVPGDVQATYVQGQAIKVQVRC